MSELLKQMKSDKDLACKREIEFRKEKIKSGPIYDACIACKDVVRAVISMFPEINTRPEKATDEQIIQLIKKYIFIEKTKELYIQQYLTESMVKDLSGSSLSKLTKETISNLGNKITSMKIAIAQSYLPKETSIEDIKIWIEQHIDFDKYKNKMQAIGDVKKQFPHVDGNVVKKIIIEK